MPPTRQYKKEKKVEVCRICLKKSDKLVTLHADSEWTRLLEYCVGISVTVKAENGSQVLCGDCSKKLKDYSEFKTIALKSDALWNNVLTKEIKKDKVIVDTVVIKDEDEESVDNHQDTAEYLDVEFGGDPDWTPNDEIKEQEEEDEIEDEFTLTEYEDKFKTEIKTKKTKNETKDIGEVSKEGLKQLSGTEFVKKFFEVFTYKKKIKFECKRCGDELTRRNTLPLHVQQCFESEVLIVKKPNKNDPEKAKKGQNIEKVAPSIFDCGLCDFQNADEDIVMKHVNESHCLTNDLNCKMCDYVGRDMADTIVHRYKHMPQEFKYKYRCPLCDKVQMKEFTLQFHYRSSHLKKAGGWCSVCNKTYTKYSTFRKHKRKHLDMKYICDICGNKYLFRSSIEEHMRYHMAGRDYICDSCGKTFKRNKDLVGHIDSVHNYSPVICDHCGRTYKNPNSLKIHMWIVKRQETFKCEICTKEFKLAARLKQHMVLHDDKRNFICNICGSKHKYQCDLKVHMRQHLGIYPYKCDSCEREFTTSSQLIRHRSVHTGIRRVKCVVCDQTFHERKRMLAHCRKKHKLAHTDTVHDHTPVNCDHCGRIFRNLSSLKVHMRIVRRPENFICEICSRKFKYARDLKIHMILHNGERNFICKVCGAKYKYSWTLAEHMRNHFGIYPHECDSCEKKFTTSSKLKRHRSVHTGIRRVKCVVCDQTFHDRKRMLAHCRSKHKLVL